MLRRLTVLAFLALVPAAHAGTATVHQCRTPGGGVAETDLLAISGAVEMTVDNRCGEGGAYSITSLGGAGANLSASIRREVTIDAPPGTTFTGGEIVRQMLRYVYSTEAGKESYGYGYLLTREGNVEVDRCGALSVANPGQCGPGAGGDYVFGSTVKALPSDAVARYAFLVGCVADQKCFHHRANPGMQLMRLTLRVRDDAAPQAQASGPLAEQSPVRSGEVTLQAGDQGLGVYRVKLLVDGREAEVQPWDPGDARCRDADAGNDDPFEFAAGQPCRTQPGSRTFTFTKLEAGSHNLKVVVEDAAGGQVVAVDRTVVVDPPGPPNGTNASAQARLVLTAPARATVTSSYARRGLLRLRGRLTDPAGRGIGNAVLDLFERRALPGATERRLALGNTEADGSFEITVPAGPSRTLRLVYRDRLGSVAETAALSVVQRVRAGLRFAANRKGRALVVGGRLLGHRPRKRLQIQVRVGATWRVLADLRTRTGGAFSYRHALRAARPGERIRVRAVVPGERGFPYLGSASRTQTVRIG